MQGGRFASARDEFLGAVGEHLQELVELALGLAHAAGFVEEENKSAPQAARLRRDLERLLTDVDRLGELAALVMEVAERF